MQRIVQTYLKLREMQLNVAFAILDGLEEKQILQRIAPKEWRQG
jgi:hypothetical protein